MDSAIAKQLVDKMYEKRKAAALDLEKQIRDCHREGDHRRIGQIIDQLVEMFNKPSNPLHVRNGGLIGLAATAIALGVDVAPYMEKFIDSLLICFTDPENRVRYFSAECLYNIAKVSKGEILVYFNPIFDALSKLAADSELSVKNGAELLDRLLKDIVAESASAYIPQYPETEKIREKADELYGQGIVVPHPDDVANGEDMREARKAFSLAHFIPLLSERIYVVSPFTRSFLVSWITVLDSVPELELITYLPEFFDGLLKYLSDPIEDVKIATENILADFLKEIRDVTLTQKRMERNKSRHTTSSTIPSVRPIANDETSRLDRGPFVAEGYEHEAEYDKNSLLKDEPEAIDDIGAWERGQGVRIDYDALTEILMEQLDGQHDEIQESTALQWLAEFLSVAPEVLIPFTPRLLHAILPNLAHHHDMIRNAAIRTNRLLTAVIQALPAPPTAEKSGTPSVRTSATSPAPSVPGSTTRQTFSKDAISLPHEKSMESLSDAGPTPTQSTITAAAKVNSVAQSDLTNPAAQDVPMQPSLPPQTGVLQPAPPSEEPDPFDYQTTVNALTLQFLSEHEETRVAALKWLIMLHQKAPKKILAMDDGTFPALLKTLSDSSEEVIKQDLQLIAQISSTSEEGYFKAFMINLLGLFSTDRKLLETRGSLIIRQLCLNLNTERIYRTFAEILDKEEDLEFASGIVQKLNLILITSPELADFRRRLKNLETRPDGQALFTTLYRSWCHNAVATFSLCLLAQAYEHASNLLYIFAELDMTVSLLVQVDKLVQLIESPVFTYLRLQLLEPDRYPFLFKCLYGLLMLLPQSSAFLSLRNRLHAVNSAGFLHISPKTPGASISSTRSKIGREEIKWQELLSHFRSVQFKHEKARRQASGSEVTFTDFMDIERPSNTPAPANATSSAGARNPLRRQGTGAQNQAPSRAGALSPLNPHKRTTGQIAVMAASRFGRAAPNRSPSPASSEGKTKPERSFSLSRKT
ncbi:ARM repeat-containing protein [Punctularia strigosozonata HHB-11173 SS5]|uniref:ARM repeat-containing protein n=1 Tax=Punctularia strigosozonata (strain HHB-11173) TaxID=741275 RepID=UPI0004417959|nr:ARM repeat-containing protein [Punctularia strigosozonata HHB-11173 SS5]EIN10503.1 ARM repeat-containing protein [Punctularia strigosozonata HHB-11173 SS5]